MPINGQKKKMKKMKGTHGRARNLRSTTASALYDTVPYRNLTSEMEKWDSGANIKR